MDITRSKMNQKAAYSVLFCALLASTFVHELSAKGVVPVSSRHHHKELLSRAASPETCELSCNWAHSGGNLNITIETINNLFVAVNYVDKAAFVLDAIAEIVLLLNGTTGGGVAINLSKQIGVSFTDGLWKDGKAELKILLSQTLSTGLGSLWNHSGATPFTVKGILNVQLNVIVKVLSALVVNVATEGTESLKYGLQLLIAISTQLIVVIKGELSGILELIANDIIDVSRDLTAIIVVLKQIKEITVGVAGNLKALIKTGISINLKRILEAKNGLEALGHIILQYSVVTHIAVALNALLNDEISILKLIAGLGGGVNTGIDGIFLIVASVINTVNGTAGLELVIQKIIDVNIKLSNEGSLVDDFNVALNIFTDIMAKIGNNSNFSVLIKLINQLKSKTLVIYKVNVSLIIDTMLTVYKGSSAVIIGAITTVVLLLKPIVAVATLAVSLFLTLITSLSTVLGVQIAAAFGIVTTFNLDVILKNSLSIITSLMFGDIISALKRIGIFGTIITSLSTYWTGGAVEFASQLSSKKDYILAWFELTVGVKLLASSSAVASVKTLIQTVTNATFSNSLSFTGSFSLSASTSSSGSVVIG
ncbi:uncharacterized protein [Euwallacea fornicatus]|uniref:uncharacterized protein n=1 Tax=Euwallacea fornicatus TaxID=995702 RepID=UPI00338EBA40